MMELLAALSISAGGYWTQAVDDSAMGYRISAGSPSIYVWASYDHPEYYPLGQPFGRIETIGTGLGYRAEIANDWSLAIDVGKYSVDTNPAGQVSNEVVLQSLSNEHGSESPNSGVGAGLGPAGLFFNPDRFEHDLWGDIGAVVRLEHAPNDRVRIYAAWRWLQANERHSMSEGEMVSSNPYWWVSIHRIDMGGVQIGAEWRF